MIKTSPHDIQLFLKKQWPAIKKHGPILAFWAGAVTLAICKPIPWLPAAAMTLFHGGLRDDE